MEQFLQVGAITSTHGIRGEVKVFPTTDDPARFKKLKKVILDMGKRQIEMEIQSVRFFKQFVIVKFKGIDNINDVEQYKGGALFVNREDAVRLEENEYYIADLIGMDVFTQEGHFGVVKDVMETGANEVYIIDSDAHGEVLVPAIRQCIEEVDVENGKMQIRLLEGLIG
ncbi:ribosome maturation factor RimM [Mediterraneibacter sp.]|jgi:16S rRNA processing protein RimM|uniref:ribosome maturation factor RimM n=1 Tax=Mediterraneibacter sp. TaxID=2316022 RepID=UPI0027B97452|nr:ribosome maturation factor RimM [Mediterraneibacter sp.]